MRKNQGTRQTNALQQMLIFQRCFVFRTALRTKDETRALSGHVYPRTTRIIFSKSLGSRAGSGGGAAATAERKLAEIGGHLSRPCQCERHHTRRRLVSHSS